MDKEPLENKVSALPRMVRSSYYHVINEMWANKDNRVAYD